MIGHIHAIPDFYLSLFNTHLRYAGASSQFMQTLVSPLHFSIHVYYMIPRILRTTELTRTKIHSMGNADLGTAPPRIFPLFYIRCVEHHIVQNVNFEFQGFSAASCVHILWCVCGFTALCEHGCCKLRDLFAMNGFGAQNTPT